MINNQLTREENVQAVFDLKAGYTLGLADVEILKRVARMALAAMDSEPVATLDVQSRRPDGNKFALVFSSAAHKLPDDVYFLYRHAQPAQTGVDDDVRNIIGLLETNEWAEHCTETVLGSRLEAEITRLVGSAQTAPVVPDKMTYQDGVLFILNNDMSSIERGTVAMRAWNACRAAMLQAQSDDDGEPTDDERIMAIEGIHNCERCGDEGWVVGEMGITRCACGQGNPVFKIDHNSDFIKHVKAVSEKVRAGNSPVIPDGYVMVPKDLLSELRDWAHPEIEKYCEMWEGRRDSEFPALRIVIADADALLAAGPQPQNAPQNIPEIIPGWIPVSERLPEKNQSVLISVNFDSSLVDPLICTARYTGSTFRRGEATVKPGSGIEEVTHWMPLPAAPQEVNHG